MVGREAVGCERRLGLVSSVVLSSSFFTTLQHRNLAMGQCQEESAARSWWWRSIPAVGRGKQDDLQGVQQMGSLPWRLTTFLESIAQAFQLAPNHVLLWQREMLRFTPTLQHWKTYGITSLSDKQSYKGGGHQWRSLFGLLLLLSNMDQWCQYRMQYQHCTLHDSPAIIMGRTRGIRLPLLKGDKGQDWKRSNWRGIDYDTAVLFIFSAYGKYWSLVSIASAYANRCLFLCFLF